VKEELPNGIQEVLAGFSDHGGAEYVYRRAATGTGFEQAVLVREDATKSAYCVGPDGLGVLTESADSDRPVVDNRTRLHELRLVPWETVSSVRVAVALYGRRAATTESGCETELQATVAEITLTGSGEKLVIPGERVDTRAEPLDPTPAQQARGFFDAFAKHAFESRVSVTFETRSDQAEGE